MVVRSPLAVLLVGRLPSEPSEVVLDGMVLFSDYTLQAKASDFGTLVANDAITVGGVAYTVRETRFSTDGLLVTIAIQKT